MEVSPVRRMNQMGFVATGIEKRTIDEAAKAYGLSTSAYLRMMALLGANKLVEEKQREIGRNAETVHA
jgi:hypothetical protein